MGKGDASRRKFRCAPLFGILGGNRRHAGGVPVKFDIRQKPFSTREQFLISDPEGKRLFRAQGDPFVGRELRLFGPAEQEIAVIRRVSRHGLSRYRVEAGDAAADMRQKLSPITYRFFCDDPAWSLEMTFTGRRFALREGEAGPVRMTARKRWFSWGARLTAETAPDADAVFCLALLLGACWHTG